jgi:HAD superfamily hydrolase (TIGR01490 family)
MKSKAPGLPSQVCSISAFDLDHTLLSDNSSYRFGCYLYRKNKISLRALAFIIGCNIGHQCGFLSLPQLHEIAFNRLFLGWDAPAVKRWALDFLDESLDPMLYIPAVTQLKQAQAAGHLTVLLSSSPDFLVEPIAKRLDLSLWEATRYAVDKDQRFCQIDQLMLGEDKANVLKDLKERYQVSSQETYAYSDSHHDLPFLTSAGVPCAVNPNRQLRAVCRRNGWKVI